jgi:Holliday junction DNA helicase RuvA
VPPVGEPVTLHAHLIAREDALSLYAFYTEQERDLFLMLRSVQAVGPKVALAILSGGAPRDLMAAIAAGEAGRFEAVPGIGKRTAERIIVELREKVTVAGDALGDAGALAANRRRDASPASPRELAREGLLELGYAPLEAEQLLKDAEGDSAEALIAGALRLARAGS